MISLVRGKLVAKEPDRAEVMTEGGIAYELQVPASTYEQLPKVGGEVKLYTALVVREDALELYGFASVLERRLFLRLQSANGIGPKVALAMLGSMSADRLVRAIRERDVAMLQTISGVGRKKAERVVLELGEKMEDLAAEALVGRPGGPKLDQAVSGLVALGYSQAEAERAIRQAAAAGDAMEVPELIKVALTRLGP